MKSVIFLAISQFYYDSTELHPTGLLYFKLDGFYGKEWKDGKEKLEYYLPDIIAYPDIPMPMLF